MHSVLWSQKQRSRDTGDPSFNRFDNMVGISSTLVYRDGLLRLRRRQDKDKAITSTLAFMSVAMDWKELFMKSYISV